MMEEAMREKLEEEYDMPVGRLMYHFYWERDMSAGQIGAEVGAPRQTVVYWLQQAGIQMRSKSLSDIQKVLLMAYIDAGLGDGAISRRIGCGKNTVRRYRHDMAATRDPIDLEENVRPDDYAILENIVDDCFPEA